MDKDKINSFEFCTLIPMISSSTVLGSGFLFLYNKTNTSSVISMIIGLIISIIFTVIFFKLFKTMPNKTLSQKIEALVPKWLYYIINICLTIILISISSLILFRLISFFNTQFLTDIPKIILSLVLIMLPLYISTKNVESLTRFSSIALFISIFVFLFNVLTLIPEIKIVNLLPIINASYKDIFLTSIFFAFLFSGSSFLLLIVPKNNISNPKKLKKYIIISYVFSAIMVLIINVWTLGALGIELINLYTYPVYIVLKKIRVFEFVNSIENITFLMWYFILIVSSSLSLLFSKNIFYETFKIKNNKIKSSYILICGIIMIFVPLLLFKNNDLLDKPEFVYIPCGFYIFLLILTALLLTLAKIKKK